MYKLLSICILLFLFPAIVFSGTSDTVDDAPSEEVLDSIWLNLSEVVVTAQESKGVVTTSKINRAAMDFCNRRVLRT